MNISKWKPFHLYDIFEIDSGTKMDKVAMKFDNPTINFVGRSGINNGVTAVVDEVDGFKPYEAGNLTLALGGAYLGSCFVQEKSFYTSQNVIVLIPKCDMSMNAKHFICSVIFKEGNMHYKAFIDELNRTIIKLVMPFIVLLDNLHINPVLLKKFVVWFSNKYSRKYENSKLISQPISVPWEKFMHEPVFLKEDVLPFKLYEFEGRKYYSYNNIEKVLKQW